jgi:hypothetical protein
VQVAVVGYREAFHPQLLDVCHQVGDPVSPVEQGVFAVGVEMNEGHYTRWREYGRAQTCLAGRHNDLTPETALWITTGTSPPAPDLTDNS